MWRHKKKLTLGTALAFSISVGCSSSNSSVPDAILRKARESKNEFGANVLAEQRREESQAGESQVAKSQVVIQPHDTWTMRQTAVFALGRIGPAAVPALIQTLRNPDPNLRRQAVDTLSRIGPEAAAAVPDLIHALSDPDPLVRRTAARALGQIGPAAADSVPALIRVIQEPGD